MKENLEYFKKVLKFTYYTSNTIAGVFSTGYLMSSLKFDEKARNDVFKKYLDNWGRQSLFGVDIEVIYEDKEVFGKGENFLFLSNHRSLADVLIIFATAPQSVRFVAKKSLFKIPFFAHAMRYIGIFEIDRHNRNNAIKTLNLAAKRLKNGYDSVVMFPEGTRNEKNGLLHFKKGAFHLAIESQVSIVPVTIIGSDKVLPKSSWKMKDEKVKIYYGKPISVKGLNKEDIPELIEKVRERILKYL